MFKKGDKITVTRDTILSGYMGLGYTVSGEVFTTNGSSDRVLSFKCDQTNAIECIDDGVVRKVHES